MNVMSVQITRFHITRKKVKTRAFPNEVLGIHIRINYNSSENYVKNKTKLSMSYVIWCGLMRI